MDLMNLLNERRLKQKVKKQKYTKYEKFITQMINKAFRIFVFRNQGDFDMWKAFLDFNKLKVIFLQCQTKGFGIILDIFSTQN